MASPTRSASNSLAKDSALWYGSLAGARLRVTARTATTVTVESVGELTHIALYRPGTPGTLIVHTAAVAADQGRTARVLNITGLVITVDVDLTTYLAVGDIVTVLPPMSVQMFTNGGHTLNDSLTNDYAKGLTKTFDDDNTPMQVDAGGDVPFYQTMTSEAFARMLMLGFGAYKTPSSGTHKFRPIEANDGSYAEEEDGTFVVQDGNGVVRKAFFTNFATRLVLDYPEGARATGTVSVLSGGVVREVGGTGHAISTGVNATRSVTDGVLNSTTTLTSATAAFVAADVGAKVTGTGIPAGTYIASVTNGTTVIMSQAATATASGVTVAITAYNYLRSDFVCDTGPGITFRSAFVEFGGSFGAGLTAAVETTVKNVTLTVDRGSIVDRTLGDPNIVKPEEDMFDVTVSGTRILENDFISEAATGSTLDTAPDTGFKAETRMLMKGISANDVTKTLTMDMPRGVFSGSTVRRQRGRYMQDFEFKMLATLDANNCVSTAIPPIEATLVNGIAKNLATAI